MPNGQESRVAERLEALLRAQGALGHEALSLIDAAPSRRLLGGRLLDGTSRGELVARLGLGLFEAGALDSTPDIAFFKRTVNANLQEIEIECPEGYAVRLRSACNLIVDALNAETQSPLLVLATYSPTYRGLAWPPISGGTSQGAAASDFRKCVHFASSEGMFTNPWTGELMLFPGWRLVAWGQGQAAGDTMHLLLTYNYAPSPCRPPW